MFCVRSHLTFNINFKISFGIHIILDFVILVVARIMDDLLSLNWTGIQPGEDVLVGTVCCGNCEANQVCFE